MRPLIGSFLSFLVLCGFVFSFQLDFDVVPTKEQIIDLKIEYIKNLSKFVIISLNKKDKTEWDKFLDIFKAKDAVNALLKEDLKPLSNLENSELKLKSSFDKYILNKKKVLDDSQGKFNFSENTVVEPKVPGWWYVITFFLVFVFPPFFILSSCKNIIVFTRKTIRKYYPGFIGYLIFVIPFFASCNYVNNGSPIYDKYLCEYGLKIKNDNKEISEAFSNTIKLVDLKSAFDEVKTNNLIKHLTYKLLTDAKDLLEKKYVNEEEKYKSLIGSYNKKDYALSLRLYISLGFFCFIDAVLFSIYSTTNYYRFRNCLQCPRCFERKLVPNDKDKTTMICDSDVCKVINSADEQANSISIIKGDIYKEKIAFPLLGPVRSGKSQWMYALYHQFSDTGSYPGNISINVLNTMNSHFVRMRKEMAGVNQSNSMGPSGTLRNIFSSLIFNFSDLNKSNWLYSKVAGSDSYANIVDCSGELFSSVVSDKAEMASMRKAAVRSNNLCVFIDPSYCLENNASTKSSIKAWMKHNDIFKKFKNSFYKLNLNETSSKPLTFPVAICVTKLDMFLDVENLNIPRFKNVRANIIKLYALPNNYSFSTIVKASSLTKNILSDIYSNVDILKELNRIFGDNLMFFPVFNSPNMDDESLEYNRRVIQPFLWMLHANGFQALEE